MSWMEGRWKKPDIQEERQREEDQHQEEYDQEKGRNSDNEEKSQRIANDEEELHNTTRFDVATWPAPMYDDLRVEIVKTGSEPYQNRDGLFLDTVQISGDKIKGKSRNFNSEWFYKALPNEEKVENGWNLLGFFPIAGKTAVELTENILTQLEGDNLDIHLCRAQGYDNAATMAGVHGGVQAIIKEHNPKTLFMPCANHLLNLCGVHCFGSVSSSVTFFGTVERVYTFFSSSTHRWGILMKSVGVSVKRLVETRWSAHHDAVKSLKNNFEKLVSTLEDMCDLSSRENADTREAASTLLPALCDFSFYATSFGVKS
ncbi:52 kDa repressor of the inhibitor of the protein kinase [Eumeta japonica]|uniref:52 kDa repressor of the inhibitor of the protein kinase n=1 Tax=Eumeta variegata TaxID=151549 RepID=A0A4C1WEI4_EUMVA|nr:52 kDa repressor of the inhibitor of the protein kinase [Eumeta japonica]